MPVEAHRRTGMGLLAAVAATVTVTAMGYLGQMHTILVLMMLMMMLLLLLLLLLLAMVVVHLLCQTPPMVALMKVTLMVPATVTVKVI